MLKAILLDVDNTLLDFDLGAKQAIKEAFAETKLDYTENVYETFTRINNGLWHDIEKGLLTREGLYKIRWPRIFEALGIAADGVAFEKLFLSHLRESAIPVEGAIELVEYLYGKYTLCIASNAAYNQQILRLKKAGLYGYMKHIFISEKIGAPKPTKAFFKHCINALQPIKAEEVMIIGDSLTADIEGAAEFGIQSCLFNRKGISTESPATYTVTKLSEIKGFL